MGQTPSWEANKSSATQASPCILWNPEVHYRIHKSTLPVPILSQIDPVCVTPFQLSKMHFNIILPFFSSVGARTFRAVILDKR
jgi:hypothetical protein